eukprot:TRINITY_DN2825_c0_g1_i5.p1 TRINITY_DN2825_c0_g1~~TRINITY_DN2825_c0_g1_i5.p1  ORF type:complete len:274 (+),score=-21.59 TRINITY_DN2825_c0_g1_i5:659-1480(+)
MNIFIKQTVLKQTYKKIQINQNKYFYNFRQQNHHLAQSKHYKGKIGKRTKNKSICKIYLVHHLYFGKKLSTQILKFFTSSKNLSRLFYQLLVNQNIQKINNFKYFLIIMRKLFCVQKPIFLKIIYSTIKIMQKLWKLKITVQLFDQFLWTCLTFSRIQKANKLHNHNLIKFLVNSYQCIVLKISTVSNMYIMYKFARKHNAFIKQFSNKTNPIIAGGVILDVKFQTQKRNHLQKQEIRSNKQVRSSHITYIKQYPYNFSSKILRTKNHLHSVN